MNTWELPERKDESVRHLRNAIFVVGEDDEFSSPFLHFFQLPKDLWAFSLLFLASADFFFHFWIMTCFSCVTFFFIFPLMVSSSHCVAFAMNLLQSFKTRAWPNFKTDVRSSARLEK